MDGVVAVSRQALLVAALIWLYQGFRNLTVRVESRRALFKALAGAVVCAGFGAMSLWASTLMTSLQQPSTSPHFERPLPEDWGLGSSPEDRAKNSRIWASLAYTETGNVFKYVDRDGVWRDYCPDSQDARHIAKKNRAEASLEHEIAGLRGAAFRTWLMALIAAVMGFLAGKSRRRKSDAPD